MSFNKQIVLGIFIGVIGWSIAAFSDSKPIGIALFIIGFAIVAINAIILPWRKQFNSRGLPPVFGIKFGMIGFSVCCIAGLLALLKIREDVVNIIFYIGVVIILISVLINIKYINK